MSLAPLMSIILARILFNKLLTAINVNWYNISNRRNDYQLISISVFNSVSYHSTFEIYNNCKYISEPSRTSLQILIIQTTQVLAFSIQTPSVLVFWMQATLTETLSVQIHIIQIPPISEFSIQLSSTLALLALLILVEHSHRKLKNLLEQVNLFDTFIDEDTNAKLSKYLVSRPEKIARPLERCFHG